MNINYFTQIMKSYLLVALRLGGANIDNDVHSEIDGALDNLKSVINALVADNQKLTARIEAMETHIIEADEAAQAHWGRNQ